MGQSSAKLPPAARDLPRLQRPARRRPGLGKFLGGGIVAALVAAGVVLANVPSMSKPITKLFGSGQTGVLTTVVRKSNLPITVIAKGALESSKNLDAFCSVEGGTSIITIEAEGTPVKKGAVVCVLDSAALKDSLTNQQITTKSAEASYKNAVLTREVAEIAVIEYVEGVYKQDLATFVGEITLAQSDLARCEDRLAWARRMWEKGYISTAARVSEELNLKKTSVALEQAQGKKHVLEDYTQAKTVKELKSEVEKSRSDELAKKATWELETSKERKLERQIAACEIKAAGDGLVVYANDPSRAWGSNQPQIEEGAQVHERQKIFSLPDISQMQVNAKVHESHIHRVGRMLKARIRVDALADQVLDGTVIEVAALPDMTNFFNSDIKVYSTKVRIDKPVPGLRPGMNAEVEILVADHENVVNIPVLAVLQFKGKDHVTKRVDDRFVQTEVELGVSNDKFVEVKQGAKEGDIIAMDPESLMTTEEKTAAFGAAGKATRRDWGNAGQGEEDAKVAAATGPDGKIVAVAGRPGEAGKGKGAGKGKLVGKGKGAGKGKGGNNPLFQKLRQKLSQEERKAFFMGDAAEKAELGKKAGLTDAELEQLSQFSGGWSGGGGGGGWPGGGGGGPGGGRGPGGGGSDQ
jgi:multidrug efflux pump subunit AcrA (membrane-fusion protein)